MTGLEGGGNYEFRVFVFNIVGRKKEPARKRFSVHSSVSTTDKPGKTFCIHMSFVVIFVN